MQNIISTKMLKCSHWTDELDYGKYYLNHCTKYNFPQNVFETGMFPMNWIVGTEHQGKMEKE